MCHEWLTDDLERTETRMTETAREEDLAQPDVTREPADEPEERRERDKEYALI